MPNTFRHSLLVALLLGFIPAGTLTSLRCTYPGCTPGRRCPGLVVQTAGRLRRPGRRNRRLPRTPGHGPKEGRFFVGLSTDSKVRVRQHVVDFLCVATGGPCKYTGRDMETAHTGLNITEDDWTIAVKALGDTLNKFKVPAREQGEVINAIAGLKSKIVGR